MGLDGDVCNQILLMEPLPTVNNVTQTFSQQKKGRVYNLVS